ncbi:hypothetical protein Btru_069657 [Bulinus truncatus]|nr:hypothetical protein Btru_069657 [Bulinus truncatus]
MEPSQFDQNYASSNGGKNAKALSAFDKEDNGTVSLDDLHRVLDLFCFVMTESQWNHINRTHCGPDQNVNYNDLLSEFIDYDISNSSLQSLQNLFSQNPNTLIIMDEVAERIHEAVVAHYHNILRDFESTDFAKIGSVTAEDLREIIARNIMRLNDEQFDRIWKVSPVNEFGNVDYKQFMRNIFEGVPPTSAINPMPPTINYTNGTKVDYHLRPSTSLSQRSYFRASSRPFSRLTKSISRGSSRAMTPMINAESAEDQAKEAVHRHWRAIQRSCRDMDIDNHRNTILQQLGIELSPQNLRDLITKYDINENGRFSYKNFLRHFLLTRLNFAIQEEDDDSDVFRRIHSCVHFKWKDMRREFRAIIRGGG